MNEFIYLYVCVNVLKYESSASSEGLRHRHPATPNNTATSPQQPLPPTYRFCSIIVFLTAKN